LKSLLNVLYLNNYILTQNILKKGENWFHSLQNARGHRGRQEKMCSIIKDVVSHSLHMYVASQKVTDQKSVVLASGGAVLLSGTTGGAAGSPV
jgi:hypothetical protein